MKFVLFLSFAVIISLFINENRAKNLAECKTGDVIVEKNNDLARVYLTEYSSKSNSAWNAFTMNWFSHLTKMGDYALFNLCDCISSKYYGQVKNESIVFSTDRTTIEQSGLDFSFIKIKQSTPLVECVVNNEDFFIMEGYRSNGLKNTMDIYFLKKSTGNGTDISQAKSPVVFLALIRSVEIPSCKVCF